MSAWEKLVERLPMRMRRTMEESDLGVVVRALCVEIDELNGVVNALLAAATKDPIEEELMRPMAEEEGEG